MCFEKAVKARPKARDKGTLFYMRIEVMRQIKFRAYVRFLREMHEVREMIFDKGTVMIDAYKYGLDRDDAPVMQYTGLKDINGVEVYEGDVVKYLTHTAHVFWSPQDFGFVHYNEVIGGYAGLSFFTGYKDFEVVGNVYQNPDLLEQNNE